jgi:Na+/H+-translocating membrane pyrophosphatase
LLDVVGNTTKATKKGFVMGSVVLVSFLIVNAYMDELYLFFGHFLRHGMKYIIFNKFIWHGL